MSRFQYNQKEFYNEASGAFTSFNEFIVSSATPLIDLKSIYGISNLRDVVSTAGSGQVTTERGLYKLSTGVSPTSSAVLTSVEYGRYVAGFEATPGIGVMLSGTPTGQEVARWGYYDDNNGFGFGMDANGMFTFKRSGGVETMHRQVEWKNNEHNIDLTKLNIYRIPFRWYGSGPARYEVTDVDDEMNSKLVWVDSFLSEPGEPITENPNLPIRAEVDNGGDPSDLVIYIGGRQFFVQGKYNPNRRITEDHRLTQSIGTTFTPLIAWSQKSSFESVSVKLEGLEILASGADIVYEVRVGGSLTGATFGAPSSIPASETSLDFDTSATAYTGGQKIFGGLVSSGSGNTSGQGSQTAPNIDVPKGQFLVLCARAVSGTATVSSILKAREEW